MNSRFIPVLVLLLWDLLFIYFSYKFTFWDFGLSDFFLLGYVNPQLTLFEFTCFVPFQVTTLGHCSSFVAIFVYA